MGPMHILAAQAIIGVIAAMLWIGLRNYKVAAAVKARFIGRGRVLVCLGLLGISLGNLVLLKIWSFWPFLPLTAVGVFLWLTFGWLAITVLVWQPFGGVTRSGREMRVQFPKSGSSENWQDLKGLGC
jgi:hypothetical protein